MKTTKVDSSKESIKTAIEDIAKNPAWHHGVTSQITQKLAVAIWFCNAFGLEKGEERDNIIRAFMSTPSGFGANTSQLMQDLGLREAKKQNVEKVIAGF